MPIRHRFHSTIPNNPTMPQWVRPSNWNDTHDLTNMSHAELQDIGINTHLQIDAHIALVNEHIDHSGVSILAGTGLSGGGTIESNRTLNVDYTTLDSRYLMLDCSNDPLTGDLTSNNTLTLLTLTASKPVWTNASKTLISKDITACDIVRTRLTPSTQTVTTGTLTSGTVNDVQTWSDGNEVHISEVTGIPGFNIEYRIDNVADFCFIGLSFYYVGSSTHSCEIQIYDDTNTVWRELYNQSGTSLNYNYRFSDFPGNTSDYINGSNQVKIRFYHPQNGNAAHDLYIDYVSIIGTTS